MKWEAVFFDFDGVILDSLNIKTETFALMFESYGKQITEKVVAHHLTNGGVSRFEKFKYYYKNFLKKPLSKPELVQLGDRFSELALERILETGFIDGALHTIQVLHKKKVPSFIVSGTPQQEIELIVKRKGLSRYFLEVHGSPRKKSAIVQEIKKRYGYQLNNCLFIGDAMSDYLAAKETGTQFLGIVSSQHQNPFPANTKILIDQVRL
jgi:HAD superfamily hydrolase (TIGR01549 family)